MCGHVPGGTVGQENKQSLFSIFPIISINLARTRPNRSEIVRKRCATISPTFFSRKGKSRSHPRIQTSYHCSLSGNRFFGDPHRGPDVSDLSVSRDCVRRSNKPQVPGTRRSARLQGAETAAALALTCFRDLRSSAEYVQSYRIAPTVRR
jgi:hypothetical protein